MRSIFQLSYTRTNPFQKERKEGDDEMERQSTGHRRIARISKPERVQPLDRGDKLI